MSGCDCHEGLNHKEQRSTLIILLLINALMFFAEFTIGLFADSTALIADSMDMLADALVYTVSLYAVGKSLHTKVSAARLSGIFQILLGLGVAIDVIRRFIAGSEPEAIFIITIGFLALIANVTCLVLIAKHRQGEIHMRAGWIFSKNDVIANVGVIVAGVLVSIFVSPLPDLIIGLIISIVVTSSGVSILRDASNESAKIMNT